jgi:hypothetical protein
LFISKDLSAINDIYKKHSLRNLSSWGHPETEVDLNIISDSFLPLVKKYDPTLVVLPNPAWDTIGSFINAQARIKVFIPQLGFDAIRFVLSDWKKVMIIDNREKDLLVYRDWAGKSTFYNARFIEDSLEINTVKGKIILPVVALVLFVNNGSPFDKDKSTENEKDNYITRNFRSKYMIPIPY